jgi:hypothetical protein
MRYGSRVKYIRKDGFYDRNSGFYPHAGTLGTVVAVHPDGYEVRWDRGTIDGVWYVNRSDVKEVKTKTALEKICWLAAIALTMWIIASWVNIITTNTIGSESVPAAWNLFKIIFG